MINAEKLTAFILINTLMNRYSADKREIMETCESLDFPLPDRDSIESIYNEYVGDYSRFYTVTVTDEFENVIDQFDADRYSEVCETVETDGDDSYILDEIIALYRQKILLELSGEHCGTRIDRRILQRFCQFHTGYKLDGGIARLPGLLSHMLHEEYKEELLERFENQLHEEGKLDQLEGVEI